MEGDRRGSHAGSQGSCRGVAPDEGVSVGAARVPRSSFGGMEDMCSVIQPSQGGVDGEVTGEAGTGIGEETHHWEPKITVTGITVTKGNEVGINQ